MISFPICNLSIFNQSEYSPGDSVGINANDVGGDEYAAGKIKLANAMKYCIYKKRRIKK
jgi:hypothetical protein